MDRLRFWASYRFFVLSAIRTDIKATYARSRLGLLWMLIQPLALVLIYSLILSNLLSAKLPGTDSIYAYPIYLMSGILGWTLFSEGLNRGMMSFLEHGDLIQKVAFPKALLPAIAFGTVSVNGLSLLAMMLVVFLFLGHWPSAAFLWLVPLFVLTLAFSVSLGLFLGLINVFFRDVHQGVSVVLQFMFWLTPIVYALPMLPEPYHIYFQFNPLMHVVQGFQQVILYHRMPPPGSVALVSALTLVFMALTLGLYRRVHDELVDHL